MGIGGHGGRCMDLHWLAVLAVHEPAFEGIPSVGNACIVLWVGDTEQGVKPWGGAETLNASIF